ncbi:RDD family protein [Flavobacterium sp. K77]|uniref:RDD family protein n=1 Tax=Flavobacterium sp. K77 TaxID=2910676 RepID=UPI001F23620E|nr:RDD family protein [Flavobacterium sp. K77]MCF6140407.1 RDD family protein [Flavobacterium sp. K77]
MTEYRTKPNLLKRFIAGLIDYLLVYGFFFAFVYAFGEPNNEGGYSVTGILSLIPFVFWFLIIVFTEVFLGATLGNALVGLKPQSLTKSNGELSLSQSIKRHLFDPIDMFPFGLIAIITIKNTDRNQRLGDIWAKTIVTEVENK